MEERADGTVPASAADVAPGAQEATRPPASGYGILLFYEYSGVDDVPKLASELGDLCRQLGMAGRLRVSEEGVNSCLSGSWEACVALTEKMRGGFGELFAGTDFKLAPCEESQRFRGFKVWESEEVCGLFASAEERAAAARDLAAADPGHHLSPEEWHEMLRKGGEDLVLFDVRNKYETRIGRFARRGEAGEDTVDLVDPDTKFYHETPAFLEREENLTRFRRKKVMMYCTGGVRCERASALLKRQLGDEEAEVYQLSGGIQRYLEAFPDNGLFEGSMHVFDRRGRVSGPEAAAAGPAARAEDEGGQPPAPMVLGRCGVCARPWDLYQGKWQCGECGMLVLVCQWCQGRHSAPERRAALRCELCAPAAGAGGGPSCRPAPVPRTHESADPSQFAREANRAKQGGEAAGKLARLVVQLQELDAAAALDPAAAREALRQLQGLLGSRHLRDQLAGAGPGGLGRLPRLFDRLLAQGDLDAASLCVELADSMLRDAPLRLPVYRLTGAGQMALRLLREALLQKTGKIL